MIVLVGLAGLVVAVLGTLALLVWAFSDPMNALVAVLVIPSICWLTARWGRHQRSSRSG